MSGSTPRIAVLMTCHNRREKTLSALDSLQRQTVLAGSAVIRVHLVDAGSTDGTARAVAERFPQAEVVRVGSEVFWGTGMRIAGRSSLAHAWTHQLWLNDDVRLTEDALAVLLDTAGQLAPDAIVIGAVQAAGDGRTTYSGRRLRWHSRWHPRGHELDLVEPSGRPEPCHTYNGNVVLLPRQAWERVGDIDRSFRHSMGDYDHGFRAARAGVAAFVTPRHVGVCEANPPLSGSREPGIGLREALRRVTSQRELPVGQWWRYCARHLWPWAPVLMLSPYARTAASALAGRRQDR